MVITKVRISDDYNEQAEILVYEARNNDRVTLKVKLDLNPDDESYPSTCMLYTPDQARQLAVYLMEAANLAIDGMMDSKPKYNGDPCHSTVDSILAELPVGPGKTVKSDYHVADELTKNSKFTFGTNFGEGKALTMSVATPESEKDRKMAVCYYVGGNEFINGCEYEYEVDECEADSRPRVIHIVQDAFVSDLQGDDRWGALKVGNVMNAPNGKLCDAYAIVNPDGGVVAQFYIK